MGNTTSTGGGTGSDGQRRSTSGSQSSGTGPTYGHPILLEALDKAAEEKRYSGPWGTVNRTVDNTAIAVNTHVYTNSTAREAQGRLAEAQRVEAETGRNLEEHSTTTHVISGARTGARIGNNVAGFLALPYFVWVLSCCNRLFIKEYIVSL